MPNEKDKKRFSRMREDVKRAGKVEEGSLFAALKDLFRMLFPKEK
ncbi:hypothetical protein ACR56S_03975 [Staphylococcus hominis]